MLRDNVLCFCRALGWPKTLHDVLWRRADFAEKSVFAIMLDSYIFLNGDKTERVTCMGKQGTSASSMALWSSQFGLGLLNDMHLL